MKKLLVVIVCAILSLPVFAQEVDISSEKVLIDGKKFYLHTVKQGQTLYGISKAYNVSTDDIIRINPESSNGVKTGQILKVPFNEVSNNEPVSGNPGKDKETHHVSNPIPEGAITHKVEKKETIYSICKKYNLSVEALYKANPSIQEKGLRAGDVLVIPESDLITDATKPEPEVQKPEPENPKDDSIGFVNHIIVKGETLSAISKKYGVTIAEILKYNPGVSADKIKEGDKLQIPRKPNEQAAFPPEQRNHNGQGGDTLNAKDSRSIEYKIKNEINIIMMLPFEVYVNTKNWYNQELGSKEYTVLPVTEMMLSYYGGCLMAFDSIKQTGLKVNMHVFDTGSDTSSLGSLVNKD
ncbi:MAG: LysM peptidoglycan-binding domain-containing protein, partial [Bacteroidales bacterium]|nr:LysM peptidoglycan-binding domain-containing protein [Bacteroidales bacterium]